MIKYTLRRLIQAIPTLFGITILVFMLMTLVPGGPTAALSGDPKMTPQQKARIARQLGVNDPWPIQYVRWLIGDQWRQIDTDDDGVPDTQGTRLGILRGDFGNSFAQRRPVLDIIGERIPATLELGLASLFFGVVIGVPIGIIAAVKHGGWFDSTTRVVAVIFNAIPVFWLGLILILLFGALLPQWLHNANPTLFPTVSPILPMGGRGPSVLTGGIPPIYQRLQYLILPTFVLATGGIAGYSRYMRASMLDVIGQDYIRTAKAKGLSMRQVWFKHGARNALMPLATFLGPAITGLLAGAAITERIFSWPGLGRLALDAVTALDYPVVMAVVILSAVATILGFVLSDILYALIDPRIRFS
ncbi:MAG: ABC transporter permease [Chloroflexi bacterium]|nr:ABC transporter permease [Chloroflexota bacterium]MCC6893801.1 ABC transporter permease [Anaerolineae bacterium]